jgi:hypothetical protein
MKILLFVGLILFAHHEDTDIYQEAYAYLNNCKNLKEFDKKICKNKSSDHFPINVINEVYPLSVIIFGNEIIEQSIMPNMASKQINVNEFITNFDAEYNFEPFENKQFNELFKKNEKSQVYVAFSKPVGNLLFAELAYNLNGTDKVNSIKELTRFNKSLAVLFIFDKSGKIKEVRKRSNHYD